MTWTSRSKPIRVGDRVAYSASFLRSTGQYSGDLPLARGTVIALHPLGTETVLAEVDGQNDEIPRKVNVANLCRTSSREMGA